jgi:hypothetical protein
MEAKVTIDIILDKRYPREENKYINHYESNNAE